MLTSIGGGRVSDTALEELMIGAGEAVGNARRHGGPPVTARIWAGSGRILVHVRDTGPGPADPLAGLVPARAWPGQRGGGLWLIHMLGLDAALIRPGRLHRPARRRARCLTGPGSVGTTPLQAHINPRRNTRDPDHAGRAAAETRVRQRKGSRTGFSAESTISRAGRCWLPGRHAALAA